MKWMCLAVALALVGCGDGGKKREGAFVRRCFGVGFTPPQCLLLLDLYKQGVRNSDDASMAVALSGASMGVASMSASGGGRR